MIVFLIAAQMAAQPSPTLWRDIKAGMTPSQVQALYPQGQDRKNRMWVVKKYPVLPQCPASVDIHYERGNVESVKLSGAPSVGGGCSALIREALLTRYGQPIEAQDQRSFQDQRFGLNNDTLLWARDGVTVKFHRVGDIGMNGPSWTMEYSVVGSTVDL